MKPPPSGQKSKIFDPVEKAGWQRKMLPGDFNSIGRQGEVPGEELLPQNGPLGACVLHQVQMEKQNALALAITMQGFLPTERLDPKAAGRS